jgi:hypothetical protein
MPVRWHSALLYQSPAGEYRVAENGITGDPKSRFVISRDQLWELMWGSGITREALDDPGQLAKLTALVAERR